MADDAPTTDGRLRNQRERIEIGPLFIHREHRKRESQRIAASHLRRDAHAAMMRTGSRADTPNELALYPRMLRRTPEQIIADLEKQIASIKKRAERPKVHKSPALRFVRAALASVDRALAANNDAATRAPLVEARSTLSACLAHNGVLVPRRTTSPRVRHDSGDAAANGTITVHSLDAYERAALQRALGEAGENRLAAAGLLAKSKSAFYRRVDVHGIRSSQDPTPDDIGRDLPLDLDAYECRAITVAIEAAGGDKLRAAKLIGISKSTFYRAAGRHGL